MAEISHHDARDCTEMAPWRRSRLRHAGFDASLAARVAADLRYDVVAMLDLLDRGCPPRLAVRILAPLSGDEA
jgi:hypothetical protein